MVEQTKPRGIGEIGRAKASVAAIETLAGIRRQARTVATDAERVTLSGWSGWGPLAKAFAPPDGTWASLAERVQESLTEQDLTVGLKGTYMAFYTPRDVAAAIWDLLRGFGYDGGPVAELGCGGGVFFATAPDGVPLVGVERDPTAAAICQLLHPRVRVINQALEDTHLPATFSAVVGNVPFGDVDVFDTQAPKEVTTNLHNYFIWRAVQALTPGGFAVLITSRHTMDAWQTYGRTAIAADADFVGALRLPNGALGGGTDALADIVILRRKGGHKRQTHPQDWSKTNPVPWDRDTKVNDWWTENPEMVLGTMKKGTTHQYGLNVRVDPFDNVTVTQLIDHVGRDLIHRAKQRNLLWTPPPNPEEFDARAAGVVTKEGWHEGSMRFAPDGRVLVVKDGRPNPLPRPGAELLRILKLRDLVVKLVDAEADYSRPDHLIEPLRADVRAAYVDYVKHHGPLNRYTQRRAGFDKETGEQLWGRQYPRIQGFRHDPDSALVFAIEVFDDDDDGDTDEAEAGMRARPAPIQTARQNLPPPRRERTDDPEQALAWCLDRHGGKVDIDYIAGLLGRPMRFVDADQRDTVRAELAGLLGDRVYLNPATLAWVTAEEYLSGDVRVKHRTAKTAAEHDQRFQRNVDALEGALPKWLGPADITANLGTPWIGPDDLKAFISEVIGYRATVKRAAGQWEVETQGMVRNSVAASAQWGTPSVDAFTLVQLALNGKVPTVYKYVYDPNTGEDKKVKDHDKSVLAAEKQQEICARFSEWVWENPDRAKRLEYKYNWEYNNLRARTFDGSHVTIDGLAPWFEPYVHQLSFVSRGCVTPAALCGHPVGAGKTAEMAMLARKLKQVGLARKPMIVVPNHLLEQIDREIRQLFPAAKILSGSSTTIAANRRAFTARCATGDWDIVLVTHSAFNAMDVAPETQARYYEDLEQELRDGVTSAAGGELKGRMVKNLAKALDKMRTKVQDLRHLAKGRDAGVRFEQLGVDYILVDEFHYYKNLALPVRTAGFSVRPSKRASDLDMKIRYLRERNNGGPHAALFSGTPVSNTMLELYVCLHYTMRPYLKKIGLGSADEWAAAFVQFVTSVEVTVDGGDFQMRTRPALFVNAPELRVLLAETADIRTAEQLGLKRPKADLHIVACEPTDTQAQFSTQLVARAEDVRQRVVEPDQDNMLKICTDGRRMATDPALVGLRDDGDHKLHVVTEHILAGWRDNPGKLQVAFLDIGTPRQPKGATAVDYQTYGRLRRMLTDAGMDVGRIRFIHDAKDDTSKARLFRDCRRGKVDVIIGSTDKLGVGTNIQKLIVAMHHIDAPFRPADVEQRDGRGLRPGNIHKVVKILRYVTKRTFDAYMWQMLTRKLTFIGQMLSGNLDRTVEDVTGDDVLSFAAIKAAATDQPLLQEKAVVESQLKKLTLKERAHRQTVARMRADAPALRDLAKTKAAEATAWEAIAAAAGTVDLEDDDVAGLIHEKMDGFRYYQRPFAVGNLTICWRTWWTQAEESEAQPLLVIDGGGGGVEDHGYRFWKVGDVRRRMAKLLGKAAEAAAMLRDSEAKALDQAQQSDEMAQRPFEQAAELNEVRARLARIEAELHEAASKKDGPSEQAGDIVIPKDEAAEDDDEEFEIDMDAIAAFASEIVGDLESEVADGLAGLLGGFV